MRTTENTFLKFLDAEGDEQFVSISDILSGGCPIDEETGEELELCNGRLFDENEETI